MTMGWEQQLATSATIRLRFHHHSFALDHEALCLAGLKELSCGACFVHVFLGLLGCGGSDLGTRGCYGLERMMRAGRFVLADVCFVVVLGPCVEGDDSFCQSTPSCLD